MAQIGCSKNDAIGGKYTATAYLQVVSPKYSILPSTEYQAQAKQQFEIFKTAQPAAIKSQPVLMAALRNPEVEKLGIWKDRADPVAWLGEQIQVELPGAAELMVVSLTADDPAEAVILVNSVVDAYMTVVANKERDDQRRRLAEVEKACAENANRLRVTKERLRKLTENPERPLRAAKEEVSKSDGGKRGLPVSRELETTRAEILAITKQLDELAQEKTNLEILGRCPLPVRVIRRACEEEVRRREE